MTFTKILKMMKDMHLDLLSMAFINKQAKLIFGESKLKGITIHKKNVNSRHFSIKSQTKLKGKVTNFRKWEYSFAIPFMILIHSGNLSF